MGRGYHKKDALKTKTRLSLRASGDHPGEAIFQRVSLRFIPDFGD